jgi:hypothetical protein
MHKKQEFYITIHYNRSLYENAMNFHHFHMGLSVLCIVLNKKNYRNTLDQNPGYAGRETAPP